MILSETRKKCVEFADLCGEALNLRHSLSDENRKEVFQLYREMRKVLNESIPRLETILQEHHAR
jgi:hypothetical protein